MRIEQRRNAAMNDEMLNNLSPPCNFLPSRNSRVLDRMSSGFSAVQSSDVSMGHAFQNIARAK